MTSNHYKRVAGGAVIAVAAASFMSAVSLADSPPASASDSAGAATAAKKLVAGSNCSSCHAANQKIVGPSYKQIADKFAGKPGAEATLVHAIKNGHVGTWGKIPMPAHKHLSTADTQKIVAWILAMKTAKGGETTAATKKYTYTVKGKTVSTSFPIFKAGTKAVTPAVFVGYEQFNSYCFRCHGADAVGGSYAPNLRRSVNNGMTESQFLSVVMAGRKSKGMPAWAGFFSPKKVDDIYQYVKARAIDVVSTGTPPQ